MLPQKVSEVTLYMCKPFRHIELLGHKRFTGYTLHFVGNFLLVTYNHIGLCFASNYTKVEGGNVDW